MSKIENDKVFGIYFAYHKSEVLPDDICNDPNTPNYPPSIACIRKYPSYSDTLNAYANTMCPASQIIEAINDADFERKVNELKQNFLNEEWLEKNIYPYI